MAVNDARDALHKAVLLLAVGQGVIFDRLLAAAPELSAIEEADLPAELREPFAALWYSLTAAGDHGDGGPYGPFAATVSAMSDDDAALAAERIVKLYDAISTPNWS